MIRIPGAIIGTVLAASLFACGGGEPVEEAPPPEIPALTAPAGTADWIEVDSAANTVTMDIVSGSDDTNNRWNFNGFANGNFTARIPEGATVTINFSNRDANMGHSIGVTDQPSGPWSATPDPTPVFEGGVTSNPTSMTESTLNGESETITFVASAVGEYALVCLVPGHATAGMWINLVVEPIGEPQAG